MILNKIILNNIGAYEGVHEIDLSVQPPNKNVILFGGQNGAGKTTLLNSVRIALFGAFAFGFATENENYYKQIYSLLNKNAVKNGDDLYQIIIEYEEIENYERNMYRFTRRWTLIDGKLREQFNIMQNGLYLNEFDKESYHNKLKETVPPALFNMCLFDGEEISKIVNNNSLGAYLKESSKVVFNLHLFESLENDLTVYINNSLKSKQLTKDEEELLNADEQITNMSNELDEINKKQENNIIQLEQLNEELIQNQKQFELYGGLLKQERDELLLKINKIEQKRKENSDNVKEFIASLLPFYLVKGQLLQVKEQMEVENKAENYEMLSNTLTEQKIHELVEKLVKNNSIHTNNEQKLSKDIKNSLLNMFEIPNVKPIHRASFQQRSEVENIINELNKTNTNDFIQSIEENQILLEESKKLRKKVEINDNTHDFKEILQNIEKINVSILKLEQEQEKLNERKIELNSKIEDLQKLRTQIQQRINEQTRIENTFVLANKIKELSQSFRLKQQQKKLQDVQIQATQMLNTLMRKKSYVSSIFIDPHTFQIKLYNSTNDEILMERLSSGEKQLLLLSIIWAMFKCSKIRLPFVFDTLLGRLDKSHKQTVLTKLIPECGEQVIILSTDSEIDQVHYNYIKPFISKEYMLEFVTEKEAVTIHKKYFNFQLTEVSAT